MLPWEIGGRPDRTAAKQRSERIALRGDTALFKKLLDLHHFILRQTMLSMDEGSGMVVQLHFDAVAGAVLDLGTELFENVQHLFQIDIGADRMREQGVKRLAMMMIHGSVPDTVNTSKHSMDRVD